MCDKLFRVRYFFVQMKYVIARTLRDFKNYIYENKCDSRDFRFIQSAESLRGLRIKKGDVIKTGLWYRRPYIDEIEEQLFFATMEDK